MHTRTIDWKLPALILALVFLAAGCAGDKGPEPSPVSLELSAATDANPDRNDRPSPVLVRVYELRSPGAFETADFFAMLEQDKAVLGGEMVNSWEFQLDPGESTRLDASFQASSGFIGVFAAFRDIERAQWRAVSPIRSGRENAMAVTVGRLDVSIEPR
jgi:type VI secretion system protein VasD